MRMVDVYRNDGKMTKLLLRANTGGVLVRKQADSGSVKIREDFLAGVQFAVC